MPSQWNRQQPGNTNRDSGPARGLHPSGLRPSALAVTPQPTLHGPIGSLPPRPNPLTPPHPPAGIVQRRQLAPPPAAFAPAYQRTAPPPPQPPFAPTAFLHRTAVQPLRSTALNPHAATGGSAVIQPLYHTKAGRGILWRARNAVDAAERRWTVADLPVEFENNEWLGDPVPDAQLQAFFKSGALHATLPHTLAKQAYLGPAGRAQRPISITLHDRIYTEHVAESNAAAEAESVRRFMADVLNVNIGHQRTFSWVIGGRKEDFKRAAIQSIKDGNAKAQVFHGAQQLAVPLSLSTRQVIVRREEFKTRPAAVHAGAVEIAEYGTRFSGVVSEKSSGLGTSTFSGPWNVDTNAVQIYHYAAGGPGLADTLLDANRLVSFRSLNTGTRATISATKMPHAGVTAVAFR